LEPEVRCGIARPGIQALDTVAALNHSLQTADQDVGGRPVILLVPQSLPWRAEREPMRHQPIENYGVIGHMRVATLVGLDGSVCLPRFDSPSVFGAILETAPRRRGTNDRR
jgi:hypothetical protein